MPPVSGLFIDPCGIRTQPLQLERLATSPEVERAVLCARRVREVGREVLESSSADFQSSANPSQLPTHDRGRHRGGNKKKPDVEVTPGFGGFLRIRPSVTSAESGWRTPFHFGNGPTDRHNTLYPEICV